MLFRNIVPSPKSALSPEQVLRLTNIYLENASKTEEDHDIALVLCHDAEAALSQVKSTYKKGLVKPGDEGDLALQEGVAIAYIVLANLLEKQGYQDEAKAFSKKAEKLEANLRESGRLVQSSLSLYSTIGTSAVGPSSRPSVVSLNNQQRDDTNVIPANIFAENPRLPTIDFKLPEQEERLSSTPHLVYCLSLLQISHSMNDVQDPATRNWIQVTENDKDEQERLKVLVTDIIRAFKRVELKDTKAIAEVVYLAPILDKDSFRDLVKEFYSGVDHSGLLDFHQLEGLARLIQGADPRYLEVDDLVKILDLLMSHVLDAMANANAKVKDLDRERLHAPLSSYLNGLKSSEDPYLVYQAAYAFQALLCVPDDEKLWQSAVRRSGKVIQGVSGLVSALKAIDLIKFMDGLNDIQKGFAGASKAIELVKTAYDNVASLSKSGQTFLNCVEEAFGSDRKSAWYTALRGADALIRNGEFIAFKTLVCEASCRSDAAFQWGVCQRLGEIAANSKWDAETRRSAVAFLGEIYRNDAVWGQQVQIKQWIIKILMQLSSASENALEFVGTMLQELETDQDTSKQALYRACQERGYNTCPWNIGFLTLGSPSLLDRAQNRPDVDGNIRLLKKHRSKERGNAVYIPPQAKASLKAMDDSGFALMEKVVDFLNGDQKVFLLLGDSGAGKSTFNRELECKLWEAYKSKTHRIPLHINLPAIDKPEHDMIARQLRKAEFTEPQIRELKLHRKFILICDGYDESQETHNLYNSNRLNQPGEWNAQMVISCRTEYLGVDYRDRFQPGDRNTQSELLLFQEAVITPFSVNQVQDYIKQYVSIKQPLWQTNDYNQALELIPTLKDLIKNPFLMSLSLEVLPRMVDPGQHLSATRVTRVALYDQFLEHWMEREKKRLGDKSLSPQARTALEGLSNEGFTQNGLRFLKRLAAAIYKEQDGQPIVSYTRDKDNGSWKTDFFGREDEKQILRETCPLRRSGNQYRFIHRSVLEYGLTLAVFDPQDREEISRPERVSSRRGSESSTLSFEIPGSAPDEATVVREPDITSPLAWRNFVKDSSLLQFLEERVQQEPSFKQQLLAYIEHSKTDKKWRTAAANAITILVRAGVQFNGADMRGIRIPGADLSYGAFDSAQLQGADLRKVDLRGVWLSQADLSGAQMTGAQFGELPYLTEGLVSSCTFSSDGKLFAVGLHNSRINVYTTATWERIQTLSGHAVQVTCIAFSPKRDKIVSGGLDETVRLFDVGTGTCLATLTDRSEPVTSVAYSPQGDQVASAGWDEIIQLWDVETGDCRRILVGHQDMIFSVVYSPKGNLIASGSGDETIRLWDVETGNCTSILSGHSNKVISIVFSPRGDLIASASRDETVRLWDVETGTCRHILSSHRGYVYSVAYSPNGDQLASGNGDGTVCLWDVETGVCCHVFSGHTSPAESVVYSPKGDQLASGSQDHTVRLWDVSVGASRHILSAHTSGVWSVNCSPKGDQIASGSDDNTIRLWDVETGACRLILKGHSREVRSVAYSPRGEMLVSGSYDKSVRLWDVRTGACNLTLTNHNGKVQGVTFSPQGDKIASASADKTVRLWDVLTGECRRTLTGHTHLVSSVAYSPNGNQIASCSYDYTVRLWDVDTGECSHTLNGHSDNVYNIAYSPHGDQIASTSNDDTLRVWNVETGECRLTLTDRRSPPKSVAYSPKGNLLASTSLDEIVRLWDVESGQCRATIRIIENMVCDIAWCITSDANYLVAGCLDGSVHMWQVIEEGEMIRTRLHWHPTDGKLIVEGASIQDVHGLSQLNKQLLKQRGAVGEPESANRLREASKKVVAMASVVSGLKSASSRTVQDSTLVIIPSEENFDRPVEQWSELSKNSWILYAGSLF